LTAEGTLSYGGLDRAVSWTARALETAGLAPGDIVGIQLADKMQHFIAALALARLGAGRVTLDASDPPNLQREFARRL